MILHFSYEEIGALRQGAETLLASAPGDRCAIAAPPARRAEVEALVPLLEGDVVITTLVDQRRVLGALRAIVECLRAEMESFVVAAHPADEGAVAAYFDFAHALSVLGRVADMGDEMVALIELVTGTAVDDEAAASFVFPD